MSIKIVLADPDPVLLDGQKTVFSDHENFNVLACAQKIGSDPVIKNRYIDRAISLPIFYI